METARHLLLLPLLLLLGAAAPGAQPAPYPDPAEFAGKVRRAMSRGYLGYGDERDPAQRARLLEISPLTRVSELRLPLMVVTGANDPRVPASEADQIIAAVRAQGREAWHLLGKDEGHGFAKKVNQDYQF